MTLDERRIMDALEARLTACTEELSEARRQAALGGQAKTTFLAAITHELKTPMNAVLGGARVLLETALTPEQRSQVGVTIAAGEAMMALIEDALDYSALERGELTIVPAPFDLVELLESVVTLHVGHADEKGVDLATLIAPAVPTTVVGDAARLRQIIRKLLTNAITFTEAGSIVVRVTAATNGRLRFELEDTGVGLAPETAASLFEAFTQADTSATRRHGGAGLGLAICRRLTDVMGGTIGVSSGLGVGSRFWVELPLPAADVREVPPPSFAGRRALVLCRARASRLALESELGTLGFRVTSVEDAAGAADGLAAGRIDLLVLDVRVPDIALMTRLGHDATHGLPTAALVLAPRFEHRALPPALAACSTWLPRPVQRRRLRETIARLFGLATDSEENEAAGAKSLRILAADDYPANLRIVTRLLEKRGHTVETVTTGTAAAAAVLASQYDLVLMDCRMPEMDGWEATAVIRAQEGTRRRTPIIALTANDGEADRQRCFDVGMDGFVAKPLRPEELFAAMEQAGVGAAAKPGSGPGPGPAGPAGPGGPAATVAEPIAVGKAPRADMWGELSQTITGLAHNAELALPHVSADGARSIRAVIRSAIRARELSQHLRPVEPAAPPTEPAVDPNPVTH